MEEPDREDKHSQSVPSGQPVGFARADVFVCRITE